jgi:hypothetical protein
MSRSTLSVGVAIFGALIPVALARCQWSVLNEATETYKASQADGILQDLYLPQSIEYQENNKVASIGSGMLSKPLNIDFTHTIYDQDACATFTELVSTDPKNPFVIGTQLHFSNVASQNTAGITVTKVDSIITTTGDWLFNATKALDYMKQENWLTIDPEQRDTREALKAAADAYLDLWGNSSAPVPWGTPCARLEGSAYTGKGLPTDTCNVGIPSGDQPPNTNRRYVIDETVGSISVLCTFGTMRNAPDSHLFRLEGGKLRYVHTLTVMRPQS